DHDMGCKEQYIPCGMVDEESAALHITFGSSYKTSDFIVETIEAKWNAMAEQEKAKTSLMQIKMDNGPESSGRRTQFLSRMVQFADVINRPIHWLYYPNSVRLNFCMVAELSDATGRYGRSTLFHWPTR